MRGRGGARGFLRVLRGFFGGGGRFMVAAVDGAVIEAEADDKARA